MSPTISAASNPSRSVMTKVPPMCASLFRDDLALGGRLVVLAEELVRSGLQGAHPNLQRLVAGHDLLDAKLLALELLRRGVLVRDDQHERLAGLYLDLLGRELVLLDGQGDLRR